MFASAVAPLNLPCPQYKWALWQVDDSGQSVVIAAVGDKQSGWADFLAALPDADCRYGGAQSCCVCVCVFVCVAHVCSAAACTARANACRWCRRSIVIAAV